MWLQLWFGLGLWLVLSGHVGLGQVLAQPSANPPPVTPEVARPPAGSPSLPPAGSPSLPPAGSPSQEAGKAAPAAPVVAPQATAAHKLLPAPATSASPNTGEVVFGGDASVEPAESADSDLSAADRDRARMHFRLGVDLYREHDFRAALIEFRRAYDIAPHYTVLFNLAQTAIELKEYVFALEYLSRYLGSGGDRIAPARRREVLAMIEDLTARTGIVSVRGDGLDGAELRLDNELVGTLPLERPLRVSVGRRQFVSVVDGKELARKVVDVAAGDRLQVQLEISAVGSEASMASAAPADDSPTPWPVVATAVTTGIFALSAGIMTYATVANSNLYERLRTGSTPVSDKRFQDVRNLTKRMAWATDGLYAATLISGVVTAVLLLTVDDDEQGEPSARVGVSPAGLQVTGVF